MSTIDEKIELPLDLLEKLRRAYMNGIQRVYLNGNYTAIELRHIANNMDKLKINKEE